jgi:hypothetical protein
MYKVIFTKTIWNGADAEASTKFALFQREETLPFIPATDLEFYWTTGRSEAPVRVRWEVAEERFVCTMPDEFHHERGGYTYDFDWLTNRAKADGWHHVSTKQM